MVTKIKEYTITLMRFIMYNVMSSLLGHIENIRTNESVVLKYDSENDIDVITFSIPFKCPGMWLEDSLVHDNDAFKYVPERWNKVSIPLNRYIEYIFRKSWDEYEYIIDQYDRVYSATTDIVFEPHHMATSCSCQLEGQIKVTVSVYYLTEKVELPYKSGQLIIPSAIKNFLNSLSSPQVPYDYDQLEEDLKKEEDTKKEVANDISNPS